MIYDLPRGVGVQGQQKIVPWSGIPSVLSFITMWVKAWRRASSPKPGRTLQPLRDLLASWVGALAQGLSWWCGVCHAEQFKKKCVIDFRTEVLLDTDDGVTKTVNLCEDNK